MSVWNPKNGKRRRNISQQRPAESTPELPKRVRAKPFYLQPRNPEMLLTAQLHERESYLSDKVEYLLREMPDFEMGEVIKENQIKRNLQEALKVLSYSANGELSELRAEIGELERRFNAVVDKRMKPAEEAGTRAKPLYEDLGDYGTDWWRFNPRGMLPVLIDKRDFQPEEAVAIADSIARELKVGIYQEAQPYRFSYSGSFASIFNEREKPQRVEKGYRTVSAGGRGLVVLINPRGEITLPTGEDGNKIRTGDSLRLSIAAIIKRAERRR